MPEKLRVDVFADPGLCSQVVAKVLAAQGHGDSETRYELTQRNLMIPLRTDGTLDLETVRQWSDDHADFRVLVTEIPRRARSLPKMVDLNFEDGLVVISLSALGWSHLRRKLHRALFDALDALVRGELTGDEPRRMHFSGVHHQDDDRGFTAFVASPWWWPGRLRLVLGMVRTNQPLKDVPKLKKMWAAAAATGAFGVFYSSIWQMANALPSWRLGLISVLVVSIMVFWLILSNGLWERSRRLGSRVEATMYNASTVVTLFLAVILMYVALYLGILIAALVVIESGFMRSMIGTSISLGNYLEIAWLSASLGIMAGALGANLDSSESVRNLTHGSRGAQRYPDDDA